MIKFIKKLIDKYRASKRDEVRVEPMEVRGRVYEKTKIPVPPGAGRRSLANAKMTVTAKVIRADGTEEEL